MLIEVVVFEVIAPKAGVDEVDDFKSLGLENILTFLFDVIDEADVLELP